MCRDADDAVNRRGHARDRRTEPRGIERFRLDLLGKGHRDGGQERVAERRAATIAGAAIGTRPGLLAAIAFSTVALPAGAEVVARNIRRAEQHRCCSASNSGAAPQPDFFLRSACFQSALKTFSTFLTALRSRMKIPTSRRSSSSCLRRLWLPTNARR